MGHKKIENYIVNVCFHSVLTIDGSISISRVHILLYRAHLYFRSVKEYLFRTNRNAFRNKTITLLQLLYTLIPYMFGFENVEIIRVK